MHKRARKIITLMALFLCLPLMNACLLNGPYPYKFTAGYLFAASQGIFADPKVNLREKNYAAADYIHSKFGKNVSAHHIIKAQPLEQLDHPGISSELGRSISEGVGLRLSELGYNILLQDVAPYDNAGVYPSPQKEVSPHFYLKGFYSHSNKDVGIILHMVDAGNGNVVARFDYKIILSREVKKLSETRPRIFRVNSANAASSVR